MDSANTVSNWTPLLIAMLPVVMGGCSIVVTWVFSRYAPRAIAAYEQISGVQLDAQQQAAIYHAADTAASLIKAQIAQGVVHLTHALDPNHPIIASHAQSAMARVPDAATEQKLTHQGMAEIIAGKVAEDAPYILSARLPPVSEPTTQPLPGMSDGPPGPHNDAPGSMAGAATNAPLTTTRIPII